MSDTASEIAGLRAALEVAEARAAAAAADLAEARAVMSCSEVMIKELRLEIAKLRREHYGQSSERRARLIDQLELQLEELEAGATEDALAAEQAAAKTTTVRSFTRRRPVRKPFPAHLPRERVVIEAPTSCSCCGSDRIVKMGEDITETLEVIPRQWKVIQTVREKFTCRDCEKISQPPAPFHATPRGWAGPNLLAMILFESEERSCLQDRSVQWTDRSDERPERKRRAARISRSTGRPNAMPGKVCRSASRRSPTRSAPAPWRSSRSMP